MSTPGQRHPADAGYVRGARVKKEDKVDLLLLTIGGILLGILWILKTIWP